MRVGIIGAGLQGRRRAEAMRQFPDTEIRVISAAHREPAQALAKEMGCDAEVGWDAVVARDDIDAVIVCTPPQLHAEISVEAMRRRKHVLCEKPLARTVEEAQGMLDVAASTGVVLKCGFNHRHHPGIVQARAWFDEGLIGKPMFVRCRYGICGRPGYEKEWRADPRIVAGGHLMEQGIHAIDLSRWFLGEFAEVTCFRQSYYWPTGDLEDNAFVLYRTQEGAIATIHSSLTQWKNLFSFEVYGESGQVTVEGLGGGYGTERAILGLRDFTAPFSEKIVEFRGQDSSWAAEWKEFLAAIQGQREPLGNGQDGLESLRLVFAAYEAAAQKRVINPQ